MVTDSGDTFIGDQAFKVGTNCGEINYNGLLRETDKRMATDASVFIRLSALP